MATGFLDTVQLGSLPGEPEDEPIVRPSLAILFRMAVGPAADYYAPRFLEYERTGRSFPSWNWAAPWVPTVWAFYHKLWSAGLAFALWPVAAMGVFGLVDPYLGDSTFVSFACALLLLWVIPGIVAGLVANTLLYHKARQLVRDAEAETVRPDEAAHLLGERAPIAFGSAVLLGAVAITSSLLVVAPYLQTAVADRVVRTRVAEALVRAAAAAAAGRRRLGSREIVADRAELRDHRPAIRVRFPRSRQREPRQRPRARRTRPADTGAFGPFDPARPGARSRRAHPLDLRSRRHSGAVPAARVQGGLTPRRRQGRRV